MLLFSLFMIKKGMSEEIVIKALEHAPAAAAAWVIGKPLVDKLLGPTAEYLGTGSQQLVQKGFENLNRVFKKAIEKSGERIDQPGSIPPKVLKSIIDDAPYNDDELAADYYGGVLASSRTGINRDDRGIVFSNLVNDLSTYQLRAHYIFYSTFFSIFNGTSKNMGLQQERTSSRIYTPFTDFHTSMDFSEQEDFSTILSHILTGLTSRNLIDENFGYGDVSYLRPQYSAIQDSDNGIVFQPSTLGIELFLWSQGRGDISANTALIVNFVPKLEDGITLPSNARALTP